MDKQKTISYIVYFCKITLMVVAVSWLIFALLSGAEDGGIIKNSPNAYRGLFLLAFVLVALRWEILGGVLIILFGIFTIIFFGALKFLFILFAISSPIILLGLGLIFAGLARFKK